ncbi:hypothetical protein [Natrinema versiforme]|uniref:AbrB/MazE/SpoVT family DNA-binding domain-containing protein n=2 Tax=root TaxID=1 RepID=A0A4P8WNR9_9EURY|nr:hypothetical protein [Natrinema versiforme]YP_010772678.1 hypothetical protein QIT49_gp11 [Natrinema versiforme icosahedral virus 1]QCS45124.1 hypothetical protein FEJ81_22925 [Natrinema versiforme]DAC85262.1 TPA_asm: hypothetical protein NVIV1gp23 [Natrinema versiforme icosahedral virus 1]
MSTVSSRVQQAAQADWDDDSVIPCGTASAQSPGGSSVYGVLPVPFSNNLGIEKGTQLQVAYHVETKTFLITPVDI